MSDSRLKIDGVVLLNKPVGLTSNAALQRVKRLFLAAKAGHTGTLDPFASGLLPICFGQATKFSRYALHGEKAYRAVLKLGTTTTTGDPEGEIVEIRPVDVSAESVNQLLPRFTGTIQQVPPMYSALKLRGKPLYEYARAGITVAREPRTVQIFQLDMESLHDGQLSIIVHCSAGTYIRTLAEDIGHALGCGAHLILLERTASGTFSINQSIHLETLEGMGGSARIERLLAPDALVAQLPRINVDPETAEKLMQGKQVNKPLECRATGPMRVYASRGFLGLVQAGETLTPIRLMATNNASPPA
ncbi:MAG: tRNA pseudouridine(55) synthase TruB [Thiobacillaceae bacterium]